MKCIATVSFGKDSTAMLLKLIEKNYPLDEKELAKNPSKSFYTQKEIDLFFDEERDKIAQILGYEDYEDF